ncbi:MAG: DUF2240 family protein [Methanosarcina sp.]|jgi:hypothetical protein|nr:DUF2240 family protein [Methanosarcina sp.]MDD3316133.1 DUF2240 family protein [Methanosarcina sp.]MDD4305083.1 DUF2240 family protein [Methanosarcina sp.]MDD4619742.1 DUF2240 family protein [Methanosarcina sp.]NLN42853.1 DUF2240 family protein [Methanosarcina sp.]
MEELKCVISVPFKKTLAVSLSEKDFEYSLAFDLKWFSPKTASMIKEKALKAGFFSLKAGVLVPCFDVESVRIPHSFKPSEDFLKNLESSREKASKKEEISFEQVLEFISADTGLSRQKLVSEINSMQDRLSYLVDIRVVALIVAKKFGRDISVIYDRVSRSVLGISY